MNPSLAYKISIFIFTVNVAYLVLMYGELPEIMPKHFNALGEVDATGSKKYIWLIVSIAAITLVTMFFALKSDKYNLPPGVSIEQARKSVALLMVSIQIIFLLITFTTIQVGTGNNYPVFKWMVPIILLLTFVPILSMFIKRT